MGGVRRPWFETIFDERYPELFASLEGNAEEEVDDIIRLLALPAGAAVEDLGCGRGRHAIPLAQRGYEVTGVDLSDKMLRLARSRSERDGVHVEWVRGDMRKFCRPGAFDACLSLFTSFGYFSDRENQAVLDNVGRSLKPGGRLLLDLRNAGKGLSRLEDLDETRAIASGTLRLSIRYARATRRARAEHILTRRDGIRIASAFDVRIYSGEELTAMIEQAGMRVTGIYGSLAGSPFDESSPRMVLLAARP